MASVRISRIWFHVRRPVGALALVMLVLMFAFRLASMLGRVLDGVFMPLAIATVTVAALTFLIGKKVAGGLWLVGAASCVFLAPFLLIVTTLPSGMALPKPAPQGHDVSYWELSTDRQIGFIAMDPDQPNGAPPVVILHGGPGGGTTDSDVTWGEEFAAAGYQTYVYDQAGVGWSPRVDSSAYSVDASVADLEAIREALGVEEVILAGHSWGGSLASHYAVAHEDHVAALLLSAPGPFGGPRVESTGPNLTASSSPSSLELRRPLPFGIRMVDAMSKRGLGFVEELVSQDHEAIIVQDYADFSVVLDRGVCDGTDPGTVSDMMRYSNYNMTANRSISRDIVSLDPAEGLSDLAVPVLIVRGVCDHVPWPVHRFYRDTIPGAELTIIEGVGHGSRVIEPMLNFLASGESGLFDYRGAEFPTDHGS